MNAKKTSAANGTEVDYEYLSSIVENVIDVIVAINEQGTIEKANPAIEELFGYSVEEVIGQNVKLLMPQRYSREHDGYLHNYLTTNIPKIIGTGRTVEGRRKDGTEFPIDLSISEIEVDGSRKFVAIIRDVSERKEAEALIEAQQRSLLELSTPAIQLMSGIVLMPLIGAIDGDRATEMITRLLETIAECQANVAILDVTGVPVIDTDVARHLLKAVAAAKMLGSDVILTGMKPTGAQTLVQLGVDLSQVTTKGSLRSGVEEALRLQGVRMTREQG
ncbi:MAG: PAS domain S-box protein [Rhodospirillaceae bacterium]|jgi:rsbT co-antagonist protein RsbR|nr:PAS domain S-box protein [Rhodospirillales bacterium]MBT3907487.1 PAS domain S-box protein [Rhodospirillaceae bacterium]MBT4701221.1 PAS domain S-box protein [Rhodospirillaceae bacterium]MBT5035552.1 PAS domain S-box protein [Rhodospirillaceae bacterium]MBT6219087.1 PAS domain S-box protein [Rhodospirillaceae bacterium]